MKILFAASECAPFVKTGGLGDVIGSLPKTLAKNEVDEVNVILPYYKKIKDQKIGEYIGYTFFYFNGENKYIGLFKKTIDNVNYYFVDNDTYYNFDHIYGHDNDGERFIFFCFAVLECLKFIGDINVIHANDWHTGLISYLVKERHLNIKTIFTIHNIKYQGIFSKDISWIIGSYNDTLEFNNCVNLLKCGIMNSNKITTVSNSYRDETLFPDQSYYLENILSLRYHDYIGIVNGIDKEVFNPLKDDKIYKKYSYRSKVRKKENKAIFCKENGLNNNFLCGLVSRLVDQKGIDMLFMAIDDLINYSDMNFFLMGSGDEYYENHLNYLHVKYPNRIKVYIGYNEELANKVYAASDVILVPSKFEPCGLSQLIAMRYGALPIVRETGGLKDTVIPYNVYTASGTGFSFKNENWIELKDCIFLAYNTYKFRKFHWHRLTLQAMKKDFGFERSAKQYKNLYN